MDPQEVIELYNPDDFPNRAALARHIAERHPEKSYNGWRLYLQKHAAYTAVAYTYDEEDDCYYMDMGAHVHRLSGDDHRLLLQQYTSGIAVMSIAGMLGVSSEFVHRWRRTFKINRNSQPVTMEETLEQEEDELVDTILSRKMYSTEVKVIKREQKELKNDAEKWRTLTSQVDYLKGSLEKAPKTVPRLKLKKTSKPYALVVCPTDFHWGKYGWVDEVGETYHFDEARKRLFEKTQSLIDRIPVAPEKVFVGAGSDWFHVDNDAGTTTKGTPQDMCASPAEILITGCKLAREHIDLLRQVAPVEVVMMAGNHDRHSSIALMMYLSAAYEDVDDVTITITANNRRYITYGDTLLGFTHGDGLSRKTNMAGLMAVEAREQWGLTKHKVWFHGHLHHQRLTEGDGCLIVQMPSLAGHDRYHARSGYTTSTAGLAAYFIDRDEGYIGSLFAPVVHED